MCISCNRVAKERLDQRLVSLGLAASRQQAQQLIRAGRVRAGERILDKPGAAVAETVALQVLQPARFVSRGGEKLLAAIDAFPLDLAGRICLDGGIATGGFSVCVLMRGAGGVYGVVVGGGGSAGGR
ncbi:MAG: SAM-dependent methyltransferase, partial [Prochlorococcaceae cyanobacterium]